MRGFIPAHTALHDLVSASSHELETGTPELPPNGRGCARIGMLAPEIGCLRGAGRSTRHAHHADPAMDARGGNRAPSYLSPPPTNTRPYRRRYSHSEYSVSTTATYIVTTPTIPLKIANAFHGAPPQA